MRTLSSATSPTTPFWNTSAPSNGSRPLRTYRACSCLIPHLPFCLVGSIALLLRSCKTHVSLASARIGINLDSRPLAILIIYNYCLRIPIRCKCLLCFAYIAPIYILVSRADPPFIATREYPILIMHQVHYRHEGCDDSLHRTDLVFQGFVDLPICKWRNGG